VVGIILLGPMVNDNAHVGDGAVLGDAPDFVMGEKKIEFLWLHWYLLFLAPAYEVPWTLQVPKVD
jgi:hypothetical protein